MLDALEVAREEGFQKGKSLGIQEGKTLGMVEMLVSALFEKFGVIASRVSSQIRKIDNNDTLDALFRQVFRCADLAAFETILHKTVSYDEEKRFP
jgi:predicted regulator of amino acid metabolism with ACT domain